MFERTDLVSDWIKLASPVLTLGNSRRGPRATRRKNRVIGVASPVDRGEGSYGHRTFARALSDGTRARDLLRDRQAF
jgi:hypothetical protein